MVNIKLVIEYDGACFSGWQQQPGRKTVQAELLAALRTVLKSSPIAYSASGRTDTGVHALGQVVNFKVENLPDVVRLPYSLSSLMRGRVSVLSAEIVPDNFHARRSACAKNYLYRILNRQPPPTFQAGVSWHVPQKLDIEKLKADAAYLIGEHDFSAFRAHDCTARSPIKKIFSIDIDNGYDNIISIRVKGSGFLKQMVRSIVGTLVDFNIGRLDGDMFAVLKSLDRRKAGQTAPAEGLFLESVEYPPEALVISRLAKK